MSIEQLIKESNAIEGITDPAEVKQSLVAWEHLLEHQWPLDHKIIHQVQKIVTLNQPLRPDQRGYYRDLSGTNVTVGEHVPPDYGFVPGFMSNWLLDYGDMTPWEAHKRFEHIHPFVDGNGRTGRMLMWWDELKRGRDFTVITAKNRQHYYKALSASESEYHEGKSMVENDSQRSK